MQPSFNHPIGMMIQFLTCIPSASIILTLLVLLLVLLVLVKV